jgi:hypothetical protein
VDEAGGIEGSGNEHRGGGDEDCDELIGIAKEGTRKDWWAKPMQSTKGKQRGKGKTGKKKTEKKREKNGNFFSKIRKMIH